MGRLFFDFEDKDTWVMLMQGVISFIYLSTHGLEVLMSIMMLVVQAVEDLCLHKMEFVQKASARVRDSHYS